MDKKNLIKKNKKRICPSISLFTKKKNIVKIAEIEVKKPKTPILPLSIEWHSDCCYICFDEFGKDLPRTMLWSCRHNICWKCYKERVKNKQMICGYCRAEHLPDPMSIGEFKVRKISGEYMYTASALKEDCKRLTQDHLQKNIINHTCKHYNK